MFLFKSIYFIRIVFFMALFFLISCSSIKKQSIKKANLSHENMKGELINKKGELDAETVNSNGINVESVVDPMADIQINAEIKRAYSKVSKFNKKKKYIDGLKELDKVKLKYPQLSGPDYQKARLFLNQSKYKEALEAVELSLNNNSRNYYSLTLKGIILKEMGEFKKAKKSYLKAIEIYSPYIYSHLNLGVLSDVYTGELSLALIQYKQYLKLTSNNKKYKEKQLQVNSWVVELERRIKQVKK